MHSCNNYFILFSTYLVPNTTYFKSFHAYNNPMRQSLTNEETEAKRAETFAQGHTAAKWWGQASAGV